MITDKNFIKVSDIVEQDFDYLTDLRDREGASSLTNSPHRAQAVRRLYVRMFVSLVESIVATFKQEALAQSASLTEGERALLREVTFELSDKGQPVERAQYAPFLSSVRFAFRIIARVRGLRSQPDYSDAGWQALQETVRVRNRLTHPKSVAEMQVSDHEMELVDAAELWFRRAHCALMEEYNAILKSKIDALCGNADT